jgi:hypothetical protein
MDITSVDSHFPLYLVVNVLTSTLNLSVILLEAPTIREVCVSPLPVKKFSNHNAKHAA